MTTRRTFLKLSVAAGLAPCRCLGPEQRSRRRRGRRLCRRLGGAHAEGRSRPKLTVHPGRAQPHLHRLPVQQRRAGRPARGISQQQFGYDGVASAGVTLAQTAATAVDAAAKSVTLADGKQALIRPAGHGTRHRLQMGRLGRTYDEAAAEKMPHAWKAGPQTVLLRQQLQARTMAAWLVMSAPANPFRCPTGPYESASLIAYWLKIWKPNPSFLILDAKDAFSKQRLFQNAWASSIPASSNGCR